MKSYSVFYKIALPVLVLLLKANNVFAQTGLLPPPRPINVPGTPASTFTGLILDLINIVLAIVGILAVAYLIFGGFRYITAGGGEEGTKEAKGIIKNALIGLIVVILSYVIIIVIVNALLFNSV